MANKKKIKIKIKMNTKQRTKEMECMNVMYRIVKNDWHPYSCQKRLKMNI